MSPATAVVGLFFWVENCPAEAAAEPAARGTSCSLTGWAINLRGGWRKPSQLGVADARVVECLARANSPAAMTRTSGVGLLLTA